MTSTNPAPQVIPFPGHRVRPGVRQLLMEARLRIQAARDSEAWTCASNGVTPAFLLNLIPPEGNLLARDDLELAEAAVKVSILASHLIHDQGRDDQQHLPFFMELQAAGLRLENSPSLQEAPSEASPAAMR